MSNINRRITVLPDEHKDNIHSLIIFLKQMNYTTKKKFEIIDILNKMKTQTTESKEINQIDTYIYNINYIYTNNNNLDKKKKYNNLYNFLTDYKNIYIPMKEQPMIHKYKNLNEGETLKKLAERVNLPETKSPAKSAPAKSAATLSAPAKSAATLSTPAKLQAKLPAKSAPAVKSAPNSTPKKKNSICDLITKY
jgi:hypothetical protein